MRHLVFASVYLGLLFPSCFYLLGMLYPSDLSIEHADERTKGVHRDSWIEDQAELNLPSLLSIGNTLDISLRGWRPDHVSPARLRIEVCGEERARLEVREATQLQVSLRGSCFPRRVQFLFENPFRASPSDERPLGTQVDSLRISSSLGFPIVVGWSVISLALILFVVSMVAYVSSGSFYGLFLTLAVSLALIGTASWDGLGRLLPLALFAGSFFIGMGIKSAGSGEVKRHAALASLLCLIAVGLGAWLRFSGLTFGLPENYHPDEVPKVNAIMRMYTQGTLNPQYFLHPSLLLYSTYATNLILHALVELSDFRDSAFLSGRIVSATAGTLSIPLVFFIGKSLFSPLVGSMGALFLSVYPLSVTSGRYLKEDSLLTFVILLCVTLVVSACRRESKPLLLLAGFVGGLAASVKYSGALSVFILIAAPFLVHKKFFPRKDFLLVTLGAIALIPIGFVIGTPFSLLDLDAFLRDFQHEKGHMIRGHTLQIDAWSQYWMYHFARSHLSGMTLPAAVLSVMGLGALTRRFSIAAWYLVALVLLFYLPAEFVRAKPAPQPERYIFPVLPFLAIAGAFFLSELYQYMRSPLKKLLIPLLVVVLILVPGVKSLRLALDLQEDSRERMKRWIQANVDRESKLLVGWKTYNPRMDLEGYDVEFISRSNPLKYMYAGKLSETGADYLLISSLWFSRYFEQPNSDPGHREVIRQLIARHPVVHYEEANLHRYGFHNPLVLLIDVREPDSSARDRAQNQHVRERLRQWTVEGKEPIPIELHYIKELF